MLGSPLLKILPLGLTITLTMTLTHPLSSLPNLPYYQVDAWFALTEETARREEETRVQRVDEMVFLTTTIAFERASTVLSSPSLSLPLHRHLPFPPLTLTLSH